MIKDEDKNPFLIALKRSGTKLEDISVDNSMYFTLSHTVSNFYAYRGDVQKLHELKNSKKNNLKKAYFTGQN